MQLPPINAEQIKEKAIAIGFHKVGIAAITTSDGMEQHLSKWLEKGYHAQMNWMDNPKKWDVYKCMPEVRSIISLALNYYTNHQHSPSREIGKISRYAWGRDYHKVISKKLKAFSQWLQATYPDIILKYYVDTGPLQDKVWAQRAGIGWIAKNGNLITREYGSWVFLAEILTNLSLPADSPHTPHCGTCTRCLTACPTGAITEPYVVDANRCIAYHTIENRAETLPQDIKLEGWVAGCDICQDVCPWNQRFAKETDVQDFRPHPENIAPRLSELAELSDQDWDKRFQGSALRRIKPYMWRRNARANLSRF